MGLKNNFQQAAKELMDGQIKTRAPEEQGEGGPAAQQAPQDRQPQSAKPPLQPGKERRAQEETVPPATVIAAGTVIQGTVQCGENLELYGEVQGDITGQKDLKLQGRLKGGAVGVNVVLHSLHMEGNLCASGTVEVDENSVIEGDIQAVSLTLNGKVKGNVHVSERLHLEARSAVSGSVTAAKLMVEEGAVIQGEVHIGGSAGEKGRPAGPGVK